MAVDQSRTWGVSPFGGNCLVSDFFGVVHPTLPLRPLTKNVITATVLLLVGVSVGRICPRATHKKTFEDRFYCLDAATPQTRDGHKRLYRRQT